MLSGTFCSICDKLVSDKCNAIFCNLCNSWVHQRCNHLSKSDFEKLCNSSDSDSWFCFKCNSTIFPFNDQDTNLGTNKNTSSTNSKFTEYRSLFSELNRNNDSSNFDNVNMNCKYYEIEEFNSIQHRKKCLSAFHLNIASIYSHFDELCTLIDQLQHDFSIIAITETRIKSDTPNVNLSLPAYTMIHTPTESSAGGALLYVSNRHSFKPRTDLTSICYKSKQFESVFVEITQPKKGNLIVGSLYRHPTMSIEEFNINFLLPLLEKVSLENKTLLLLGDFNIDLLKCDIIPSNSSFLDILCSHSILPSILLPTRLTPNSKTLIDNIFISSSKYELTAGNEFVISQTIYLNSY